ncbi:hypothetical protein KKC13_11745 [bacterium]|nr:hypothetical protein [bacterium]MBU1957524.1 hypothetical protein [bacterium]
MNIKKNIELIALSSIVVLGLTACGEVTSSSGDKVDGTPKVDSVSTEVVDVTTKEYLAQKVTGDQRLELKLGTEEKDVYLIFSNPSTTNVSSATVSHNQKISKSLELNKKEVLQEHVHVQCTAPSHVQAFNSNFSHLKKKNDQSIDKNITETPLLEKSLSVVADRVEESKVFYMGETVTEGVAASARKVVNNILTAFGTKSLSIWVQNDSYGVGCQKSKCVTQTMVDILADKFLKEGLNNDIYDGVTNIFGEEWGSSNYSNLIQANDNITILLADIGNDNSNNGGVIGYFYSKDNLIKESIAGSNERIMFYVDSVLYANGGDETWDENDFWPKQVFATLAHEFQHMIHYYQKSISREIAGTDKWINEMLSQSVEDLMAVKMGLYGPRYVPASRGDAGDENNLNGQFPLFNSNNSMIINSWDNSLADYSKVSSFGAYLLRNYGGGKVLHDMVHNIYTDERAIEYAVHQHENGASKTFDDLIHDWGVAVLMSKRDDLALDSGFLYNAGDYISTQYNGVNYDLGSINFFNYNPSPTIHSSMGTVSAKGSYFYKVGENLTGDVVIDIGDTSNLTASVVVVK